MSMARDLIMVPDGYAITRVCRGSMGMYYVQCEKYTCGSESC